MSHFQKYIGIPYAANGRSRKGADCYGLLCLYMKEEHGIELPRYSYDDPAAAVAEYADACWEPTDAPEPGCAVLLRQFKVAGHVGVVVSPTHFIHCEDGIGSVLQRLDDPRWSRRIVGFYRHKQGVQVTACPSPLSTRREVLVAEPGSSLQEIIELAVPEQWRHLVHADVHGQPIPPKHWGGCYPKEGAVINLRVVPQGGGRNLLRTILTIAVMAWAGGAGGRFFGRLLGGARISPFTKAIGGAIAGTLGMMAVNALVPPPQQTMSNSAGFDTSNIYSLTGTRNRIGLYEAIPVVLGTHKIYPPYGSKPYTSVEGSDQYLRCLFVLGYGELYWDTSTLKIGDTALSSFSDVATQEIYGTAASYLVTKHATENVTEDAYSVDLEKDIPVVRTTAADTNRASVDIIFPTGLCVFNNDGSLSTRRCAVTIEYRETGTTGTWSNPIGYFVNGVTLTAGGSGYTIGSYNLDFTDSGGTGSGAQASVLVSATGTAYKTRLPQDFPTQESPKLRLGGYLSSDKITTVSNRPSTGVSSVTVGGYGNGYTGAVTVAMPAAAGAGSGFAATVNLQEGHVFEGATATPIRESFEIEFPSASQWDIRVTRTTDEGANTREIDACQLAAVRSMKIGGTINGEPPYLAKIAMKIKATGELNGLIDSFNLIASSKCKSWNGSAWVADQITSNPADLFRYVLQGPFNQNPVADARIDLDTLADWHDFCDTKGFTFNAVIDKQTTVKQMLEMIASAGRAVPTLVNNKYSVIIDDTQATPVQVFTPRNSRNFHGERVYVDTPHCYRVAFVDEDGDYLLGEQPVYKDGYDSTNATKFEKLELPGVTNKDHAWKLGRYFLAVAENQQETFSFEVDFEHLVCTRGDRVDFIHDASLVGIAAGRVKSVTSTELTVDENCPMDAGESYVVRVRKSDGTITEWDVVTVDGDNTTLTRSGGSAFDCAIGDLFVFGKDGEAVQPLIIRDIEPIEDLAARLTCVPYVAGVYTADSGSIPSYSPVMTVPDELKAPNAPRAFGSTDYLYREGDKVRQGIFLRWFHPENTMADLYEIQHRPPGGASYVPLSKVKTDVLQVPDVSAGLHEFRIRTLRGIRASGWIETSHFPTSMNAVPEDIVGIRSSYQGTAAIIRWQKIEDIRDVTYEVRYSLAFSRWQDAAVVAETTSTEWAPQVKGYYYVKARANGVYSANRAIVIVPFASINVDNAKVSVSEDFDGTIDGKLFPKRPDPGSWDSGWRGQKSGFTTWDTEYDPSSDGVPTDNGWTQVSSSGDHRVDDDGYLEISDSGPCYWRKAVTTSSNAFVTAEFELRVEAGDVAGIKVVNDHTNSVALISVEYDRIKVRPTGLYWRTFHGDFSRQTRTIKVELRESAWLYLDDELLCAIPSLSTSGTSLVEFGRFETVIDGVTQSWGAVNYAVDTGTADTAPETGDGWTKSGSMTLAANSTSDCMDWSIGGAGAGSYSRAPSMSSGDCLQIAVGIENMTASSNSFSLSLSNSASGYGVKASFTQSTCTITDLQASPTTLDSFACDLSTPTGWSRKGAILTLILWNEKAWLIRDQSLIWYGDTNGSTASGDLIELGGVSAYGIVVEFVGLYYLWHNHSSSPDEGFTVLAGDGGTYAIATGDIVDLGYQAQSAVSSELDVAGISRTAEGSARIWREYDLLTVSDLLVVSDLLTGGAGYGQASSAEAQIQLYDGSDWDDWSQLLPGTYYGEKYNLRIGMQATTSDPLHITAWDWEIDMPDVQERQAVTSLAGGGLTVTWNKNYQTAPEVIGSIINEQAGDHLEITSITTTQCTVSVYNGGSRVVRTVHVIANGY